MIKCVIADPPWLYNDKMEQMKSTGNGASSQYRCLPFSKICTFLKDTPAYEIAGMSCGAGETVGDVIAADAHLYLWITNSHLVEGYGQWLCDAWGFKPKTLITWVKGRLPPEGGLIHHFNQGRYYRGTTEHLMFATRGHCPALVHNLPSSFVHPGRWKGRLHSEKPDIIHTWAEQLSPGPRLELFARQARPGWFALGDELTR
jgi:N6-adenosine-specific RNA methylase IME4